MKWTCPMHPEVEEEDPGSCPKCGMDLESSAVESNQSQSLFLKHLLVSALLALPVVFVEMGRLNQPWLSFSLTLLLLIFPGRFIFARAWESLLTHSWNMFTLIALGVGTAFAFSSLTLILGLSQPLYFESAAVIVFLVIFGQWIEHLGRKNLQSAYIDVHTFLPNRVHKIISSNDTADVSIDEIHVNDHLRILPGEKIPADGTITLGSSFANESFITGESDPVKKEVGSPATAGSINLSSVIEIQVKRVGDDTTMGKIIEKLNNVRKTPIRIARIADRVAAILTPIVIFIALLSCSLWIFLSHVDDALSQGILSAVSVLIIACPCAIGLATPLAVVVGISRAAQSGIIIKEAHVLETASKIDTLLLDKTGTLTQGAPEVLHVIPFDDFDENTLIFTAYALESQSNHPLARAVCNFSNLNGVERLSATNIQSHPGQGITGSLGDDLLAVGKLAFVQEHSNQLLTPKMHAQLSAAEAPNASQVFVSRGHSILGVFLINDPIKPQSEEIIKKLHFEGIEPILLTGDCEQNATDVAQSVAIETVHHSMTPQAKADQVKELIQDGRNVAMVGDGINDAIALAQAHIGIAMSTGDALAIESGDVTLIHGDLSKLNKLFKISKKTLQTIYQNLFLAFVYNLLAIPIAAGLFYPSFGIQLSPMIAAVAMSASSICVILNVLRLKYSLSEK